MSHIIYFSTRVVTCELGINKGTPGGGGVGVGFGGVVVGVGNNPRFLVTLLLPFLIIKIVELSYIFNDIFL